MPPLIRLYIRQCLIGFGISAIFVGLLLALNVGGLRDLVMGDEAGLLAIAMLFLANGTVFAGVQFGITIMRMGERDADEGPRGGTPERLPIRVRTEVPQVARRSR